MFWGQRAPLLECQYIIHVKLLMFPGDASFSLSGTMTLIKISGPGALVPSQTEKGIFLPRVCDLDAKSFLLSSLANNQNNGSRRMVDSFLLKCMVLTGAPIKEIQTTGN